MKQNKKAFSLIEISIVLLIIGVLIAGVTQGTKLVRKFRLTTARTLTQSSPVSGIYGLVLWLDTTSEKSFLDSETVDGTGISTWYDLNTQRMGSTYTLTSSGTLKPTYKEDVMNGLPALKFDGSNDTISATFTGQDLFGYNEATVFIVNALDSLAATYWATGTTIMCWNCTTNPNRFYLGHRLDSQKYTTYAFSNSNDPYQSKTSGTYDFASHYNRTEILTLTHKSTSYSEYRVNGTVIASSSSDSSTITPSTSATLYVGSYGGFSGYFTGYISELIFFNRALTAEERAAVETYLKQKWGIK